MTLHETDAAPTGIAVSRSPVDRVIPDGRWNFDDEVTAVFDNMLERSIPHYRTMRQAVLEVGSRFVQPGACIVDVGASRGEALAPFLDICGGQGRFIAIEPSAPMAEALRTRFAGTTVEVHEADARTFCPSGPIDLVLSVLTLQFVPLEHRQRVIKRLFREIRADGALIMVEKVLGSDSDIDDVLVDVYHHLKLANGYTREDIDRKALSLEGVLVPVTAHWNEDMLRQAGFTTVECCWRWMNFAAWIAVK